MPIRRSGTGPRRAAIWATGGVFALGCGGPTPPVAIPCPAAAAPPPTLASAPPASALAPRPPLLRGDEGMWLLDDFPSQRVAELHGFGPSPAWLEHVRLAAVRLAGGCSGSFVSPGGLVMTNHHCVARCLTQLSTAEHDYTVGSFYAKSATEERRCPEVEVDQLLSISDVTERMQHATAGRKGGDYFQARRAEQSRLEQSCATSAALRCDVVSLYHGGRYHLYRYRRYQDVRLVFAPEFAVAFFGGDPDNFMFPRYDLDLAFLRVYDQQRPLASANYFRWSPAGPSDGDLTFVAGHPWGSSRELTVAELEYLRDVALPARLLRLAEARGLLTDFGTRGQKERRISGHVLFGVENGLKALKGRVATLREPDFFASKVAAERELRRRIDADPELHRACAGAWEAILGAENQLRTLRVRYEYLEQAAGFWSELFGYARRLLRAATEFTRPNELRLHEYVDSERPALAQWLLSGAPVHTELELLTLTHSLTKLREELGPDDPLVHQVLGREAPAELAARLVKHSRLAELGVRRQLLEGGTAAVRASTDPMLELARKVDPASRAVRHAYEEQVEAVVSQNSARLAHARFRIFGTTLYPDATATLRLSFGVVRGFDWEGATVPPFTTLGGAFARATGRDPFALPKSWLDAPARLDLGTRFNFCTTHDIIGGNSGSPVLDREARIVGLIFDGNLPSLGGDYWYDPQTHRAVAVDSAAILETLRKIYGATRIVDELARSP